MNVSFGMAGMALLGVKQHDAALIHSYNSAALADSHVMQVCTIGHCRTAELRAMTTPRSGVKIKAWQKQALDTRGQESDPCSKKT